MSYVFNANEVFEMAIEMEKNGTKFYQDAKEAVSDEKQKELLQKLSDMEAQHVVDFQKLKEQFCTKEMQDQGFDSDNLSFLYLKAIADTKIFFEREKKTGIIDILKDAILAEKESIVFYLGMKDLMPENLGKEKIDAIIKEEMGHIRFLSSELLAIKK